MVSCTIAHEAKWNAMVNPESHPVLAFVALALKILNQRAQKTSMALAQGSHAQIEKRTESEQ